MPTEMHKPAHPGRALRDVLRGRSRRAFAARVSLSGAELGSPLSEKAVVTPKLSRGISAELGTRHELWIDMQWNWEWAKARKKPTPERLAEVMAILNRPTGIEPEPGDRLPDGYVSIREQGQTAETH